MPHIVFFRAANVGGHQTFQPKALERDLSGLDVVSIGAAGTFAVRAKISETALRNGILKHLSFTPEIMICPSEEIRKLTAWDWSKDASPDTMAHVSIMSTVPASRPKLPINVPEGSKWQVSIVKVSGRYVLSLRRPGGTKLVYPNEVVERAFKVPATTRNWATMIKICSILDN